MKPIYLDEAQEKLGVTRQTIYTYVNKGYLKKFKNDLTGKVYFLDKDIIRLKSILDGDELPFTQD